jgi:hypothetical protein
MEFLNKNYTKVVVEKLIDKNNQFKTAIILIKEEGFNTVFPIAIKNFHYEYLKSLFSDRKHEKVFMCDILYDLHKPKSVFINLKNGELNTFYLTRTGEIVNLNILEIMSFVIRYYVDLYIESRLIHPQEINDYFIKADSFINNKVDLYRLDKNIFDNLKH